MSSLKILETLTIGVLIVNKGTIIYSNKAMEKILGWPAESLVGEPVYKIFFGTAFVSFLRAFRKIKKSNFVSKQMNIFCLRSDGKSAYCLVSMALGDDGLLTVSLQDAANGYSGKDLLTGLYSRKAFFVLAKHEINMAKRFNRNAYLIFVNVDGLKIVNDSMGYFAVDELLVATADILRETFRVSDVICRFGGDEFVVLALGEAGDEKEMARRIKIAAAKKNETLKNFQVSLNVEVVRYDERTSLKSALEKADKVMYRKKGAKKEKK